MNSYIVIYRTMADTVPVFILNNQFPAFDQKAFTTAAICSEAGKTQTKTSVFEIIRGRAEDWRVMEDLFSQCNSKTGTANSGILAAGGYERR